MRLGLIVEGHGDALALPTLVRRIASEVLGVDVLYIHEPAFRVKRGRFAAKFDDYERALELLAKSTDAILVVLDTDDDEYSSLREELEQRALNCVSHRVVRVAPADREFECWFLASLPELAGLENVVDDPEAVEHPDAIRGAKGVFERNLANGTYSESVDQKRYCRVLDIAEARRRSPSFEELISQLESLLVAAAEEDETTGEQDE